MFLFIGVPIFCDRDNFAYFSPVVVVVVVDESSPKFISYSQNSG